MWKTMYQMIKVLQWCFISFNNAKTRLELTTISTDTISDGLRLTFDQCCVRNV